MPKIFETMDKIKPVYDMAYKVFLVICKLLLGGYEPTVPLLFFK